MEATSLQVGDLMGSHEDVMRPLIGLLDGENQ